ncbi:MAG: MFS transporter [Acidobacteriota bacterium]|nr:MFS transporter [Acidobacteriota bacterium]
MRRIVAVYRDSVAGLPSAAWLLSTGLLVNRAGTMVLPFLALYLTEGRGLGMVEAGSLVGLYGVGAMAGSWVGGLASDRLGTLWTQVASLLASGALFLAVPACGSLLSLAAVLFAASTAAEAFRPAVMSAMAGVVPPELAPRGFALLRQAANLGMAIGPAVGGMLAKIDFVWLFLCEAATCWAAAAVLALGARHLALAPRTAAGGGNRKGISPWKDGPFLALVALVVVLVAAFFQLWTTVPLYLRETYALDKDLIGALFALNALLILVFELPLIRAIERRRRLPLIGAGALAICVGLAILPLGRTVAWAALSIVVWTLGEMLALPLLNVVVAERAGPGLTGRYMGVYTLAFSVAFVVAPLAGTRMYEGVGPDALWASIGLLGVVLGAWALVLEPHLDKQRAAELDTP